MRMHITAAAIVVACVAGWTASRDGVAGQTVQVPIFEYDPTFPKPMKENWAIGPIGGLAVDRQDHLYVVQRPGGLQANERFTGADDTPPKADCCIPAPPVLEFDQGGTLVRSWGGPGAGLRLAADRARRLRGCPGQCVARRQRREGRSSPEVHERGQVPAAVRQAGDERRQRRHAEHGQPANLTMDPATNEVYVADGYSNRRVIVLDAETFAFKRMWGAYGNKPDDADLGPYNPDAPPAQQFRLPHNIAISRDGLRLRGRSAEQPHSGVPEGRHLRQGGVRLEAHAAAGRGVGLCAVDRSAAAVALHDRRRQPPRVDPRSPDVQIVARFGQQGLWGGSLNVPHAIAVDSRGNIYVGRELRRPAISALPLQGPRHACRGGESADDHRPLRSPPNGHVAPHALAGGDGGVHANAGHHHRQHRPSVDGQRAWVNRRCACRRSSRRMRWLWRW